MKNSGNKIISVNDFGKMTDATRQFALNCLRKAKPNFRFYGKCPLGSIELKLQKGNVKLKPEVLYKSSFSIAGLTYSGHDTDEIFKLCKIKVAWWLWTCQRDLSNT